MRGRELTQNCTYYGIQYNTCSTYTISLKFKTISMPTWYKHYLFLLLQLENVQCCLDFLHAQKVQGLEQVTAVDIRDAKLKAVLALFFALSRHKQASKQRTAPSSSNAANSGKNSTEDVSLSSVQRITGGSSCDEVLTSRESAAEMTTLTANRYLFLFM